MCFVPLDLRVSLNFALLFKAKSHGIVFFLNDVRHYCEERKIKLLTNVYMKISRNLGGNFWIFGNSLATLWHFSEQLSSILRIQSRRAYS